ncbi:MAG TPA: hypothetical protein VL337_11110 [Acidimicrobiales bacterium]|jgi:hypothetical protein|nr:hypothetical protein [Acidimicrobiales bacterium]
MRPAPTVAGVVLVLTAACGGSARSTGSDPVANAEDPAVVLANSQYPELPVDGLKARWLLDTGQHLTHVLSFVEGLRLDEKAATDALRHFEDLRQQVDLAVDGEAATLTYTVRPRNYPQRYVVIVPDGAPLPRWAGRPEEGRSFASTRPVNVDHAVTVIRVANKPFGFVAPFDALPPAGQLDLAFLGGACARSTAITTDEAAAYKYGANIHNQGEGVICDAETRQLAGRQQGLAPSAMAAVAAANRVPSHAPTAPALVAPPFDERRYAALPALGPIFTLA